MVAQQNFVCRKKVTDGGYVRIPDTKYVLFFNPYIVFICYRNRSLSLELQTTMNVGGGSKQSKKILAVDATLKENLKNASNA